DRGGVGDAPRKRTHPAAGLVHRDGRKRPLDPRIAFRMAHPHLTMTPPRLLGSRRGSVRRTEYKTSKRRWRSIVAETPQGRRHEIRENPIGSSGESDADPVESKGSHARAGGARRRRPWARRGTCRRGGAQDTLGGHHFPRG